MQLSKETLASFDACLNGKIAPRGNSIIDRMIHRDYVQQQQQQQHVNHERGSKSNLDQSKRKKMIKKKKRQEKRLTKGMTKSKSEPTQLAPPPSFPPPSLSSTQGSGSSINMRNKQKKRKDSPSVTRLPSFTFSPVKNMKARGDGGAAGGAAGGTTDEQREDDAKFKILAGKPPTKKEARKLRNIGILRILERKRKKKLMNNPKSTILLKNIQTLEIRKMIFLKH